MGMSTYESQKLLEVETIAKENREILGQLIEELKSSKVIKESKKD